MIALSAAGCGGGSDSAPPSASFTASCTEFVCDFDASKSNSRSGGGLNYYWDFGDDNKGWTSATPTHAYSKSGDLTVVLTVQDANGLIASSTKTISVTGNPAAAYFTTVHDGISLMLMADDFAHALAAAGDGLQDAVEAKGNPGSQGYSLQCASGTAQIESWTDANNSLSIDGTETLTLTADKCRIADGMTALTSIDGINLTGDFDGATFSIEPKTPVAKSFGIGSYSAWYLRANVDFTRTINGSDTVIAYESDDANFAFTSSDGSILLNVDSDLNASSGTSRYAGMQGTYSFKYNAGNYTLTFENTGSFSKASGSYALTAGRIKIASGTTSIFLSPDADPAYLKVEVDQQSNGSTDIDTRFPQSVAIERLAK